MKQTAKFWVARILGWQVRRLMKKNDFKVVAVAGSIGKTSTKLSVANVLSKGFRVRYQNGNYNDPVSVPLIFFDRTMPSLFNPIAWLFIFIKNELSLLKSFNYDVVVIEVGTDGPGQIGHYFSWYLRTDITVLTAISPEHMEYFADMDEVAHEELMVADFSKHLLVNSDLVDDKYSSLISKPWQAYAIKKAAEFSLADVKFDGDEASFKFQRAGKTIFSSTHQQASEPQLYSVLAASAVASLLGMKPELIEEAIHSIPGFSGRMQHLRGHNDSKIIDDTYNASPQATFAALDNLYRISAGRKIALLGNMNELGKYSKDEHTKIGNYCDAGQLALVVTLGPDANKYLAPAAEAKGCTVHRFDDPISAGKFIATQVDKNTVVLAKGSQNKVFAEEAVKQLLADPGDVSKLVRQSAYWLKIKQRCFPGVKIK